MAEKQNTCLRGGKTASRGGAYEEQKRQKEQELPSQTEEVKRGLEERQRQAEEEIRGAVQTQTEMFKGFKNVTVSHVGLDFEHSVTTLYCNQST